MGALDFVDDAEPPGRHIGRYIDGTEGYAPVTGHLDLLNRAAPALVTIELDEAVDQGAPGEPLEARVERGADGETTVDAAVVLRGAFGFAVEPVFTELADEGAADFFREVVGGVDLGAEGSQIDLQILRLGGLALLCRDVAVLGHLIDDPVAADLRALLVTERMIVVRCLGQRRQIGDFLDVELVEFLAEVIEAGGGDAIRADAEIDLIQVQFEDARLRIGLLDANRENGFLQLALELLFASQQEVLGDLLRDGRGALRATPRAEILEVGYDRSAEAVKVETAVLVEALVLGREIGGLDELRYGVHRHEDAALTGVLGHQAAVVGVNSRHDRRLVTRQTVVVRQIARRLPEQKTGNGRAAEKDKTPEPNKNPKSSAESCAFAAASAAWVARKLALP